MIDYQGVVDVVRYAIQSEDCELTDELLQANEQYSEACRDVNKRLRKIGKLLESGLRSEAIQLGEESPEIKELASVLTFPEMDAWAEVVALYDLPRIEPLNQTVIDQLNEAQLIEQPLSELLSKHRLFALIRAPLQMRLEVLRELMEADPETFAWEDDVRALESARFLEMAAHVKSAVKSNNQGVLKELYADLKSEKWLAVPPGNLLKSVKNSLVGLSRSTARQEAEAIAKELDAAFSELDLDQARQLRTTWQDAIKRAHLPGDDGLLEQVEPALGWIQDEDEREANEKRYEQLLLQLEHALNNDTSIEELSRLEHEVRRLDRDLPELLETRYHSRIESLSLSETRSTRLKMGSVIGVLVLLIGLVIFVIQRQNQIKSVATLATHVEQLLNNREYEQAKTAIDSRTDILKWDNLAALQNRYNSEVKLEEERINSLNHQMNIANAASTFTVAMAALKQAEPHLMSVKEKLAHDQLQREWEDRNNQAMALAEKELQDKIQAVTNELLEAGQLIESAPEDENISTILTDSKLTLATLTGEAKRLRPKLTGQIELLSSRRDQLSKLHAQQMERLSADLALSRAALIDPIQANPVKAIGEYRKALIAYSNSSSESQTKEILSVADEDVFWLAVLEWKQLTNGWQESWPLVSSPLASRIEACEAYQKKYSGGADAPVVKNYISQLKAIASREGPIGETGPGLKDQIGRIFENPLIAKTWILKTKDGRTFYSTKLFQADPTKLDRFEYYVGYKADDIKGRGDLKFADFIDPVSIRSPSTQLAIWVKEELSKSTTATWSDFIYALAIKLVTDEEMDPFLRMDLLRRTLNAAAEGDVFLAKELAPHLSLLQDAPINPLARWMDPDDKEGDEARDQARELLVVFKRLTDLDDAWKGARQAEAEFTKNLKTTVTMVGWLQNREGKWMCQTNWKPEGTHELLVTFVDDQKTSSQWRSVGTATNGDVQIKAASSSFFKVGRPVFAVPRSDTRTVQK